MNESFQSSVRALSHKGFGVVDHPDGRVFFVRGTWPGDAGRFSVPASARSYDEAFLEELSVSAPQRTSIPCPHRGEKAGQCGGCPWMGIDYAAQLEAKEQRVKFLLSKNQIEVEEIKAIIPSPAVFGYRNRAQFKTDGDRIGYVSEGSNVLAPIERCLVLNEKMTELLEAMKATLPNEDWRPSEKFSWSYLDVDDLQGISGLVPNRRRPFRQGNHEQNLAMKSWIESSLGPYRKDWPVLEAFCGSGNFTEALSLAGFSNILAAEVRGSAVEELREKNLPGVRIMEIDMTEKGIWQQLARRQPHTKILIVDPPREGIEKRRGIFKYLDNLQVVLYISCEPTTWARDVKDFLSNGFKLLEVTPLDLFPHTPHVEILSLMVRR